MRLSNIFEAPLTPSPEMGMNPAPKPGSSPATAAVAGANAMKNVTGQTGSVVAKALGALSQGKTLTPILAKALDPYAEALTLILSDPKLRTKFVQLMKQAVSSAEKPEDQPTPTAKNAMAPAAPSAKPSESVTEDQDSVDAVAGAITRRIMMQHTDLLSKYGPVKVMAAIDDVADFAGSDGLDEIGSSDVSIWTKQVIQDLESGHFDHMESVQEAEGDKPYICLYVKKGKVLRHECYAPTSYEAAKKAAQHWGLKSTAGVSAHLADDSDDVKKEAVGDYTVKKVSAADAWKKHTGQKTSKSKVPVDPKTGKTLYQKVTSEDDEQLDEILPALGAMAGRALVGAEAGALARGVASGVGRAVGTMASNALDDNDEDPTDAASTGDKVDTVTLDIPLLLRVLEFAREDAEEDMDLHDVAERMIAMSKDGPLNMDDYDSIVGSVEALPAPEENHVEEGYYAPGPETMPGAVGPQDNTTVSFNQSKTMGDATLNVSASAKDMEELHRILKLAGINVDSDGDKQEPNMQDVAVALEPHAPEAPAEEPCGCEVEEPADVKYSTDKQTLINVLRDKLQKRLA